MIMSGLCTKNKWYPTEISALENFFSRGLTDKSAVHNLYVLIKNLCYNAQYLEFQTQILTDIKLSDVLKAEVHKTFILATSAIIEGVLYYIVYESGHQKTEKWEELKTIKGNEFAIGTEKRRLDILVLKRLNTPTAKKEIRLRDLIQIAEHHHLFGPDHTIYARLQNLRKLRNKIHLYISDKYGDHDYNIFGKQQFSDSVDLLRHTFTATIFNWTEADWKLFPYLHETA
jgi:hypothetical protein